MFTNILLGFVIFLLINIYGGINLINSKIEYSEDMAKLKKLSEELVRGPIITKTEGKFGRRSNEKNIYKR